MWTTIHNSQSFAISYIVNQQPIAKPHKCWRSDRTARGANDAESKPSCQRWWKWTHWTRSFWPHLNCMGSNAAHANTEGAACPTDRYVDVYTCIYADVCVCMSVYLQVHIDVRMHARIHVWMYVCMYVKTHYNVYTSTYNMWFWYMYELPLVPGLGGGWDNLTSWWYWGPQMHFHTSTCY